MKLAARLALAAAAATAVTTAGVAVASAATPSAPTGPAAVARHPGRLLTPAQRQQLRTSGHLRATVHTRRHGDVTLDLRVGTVTALSPTSLTVLSKDGSSASFGITATTKVRSHHAAATVATGDRVLVVATTDGHARRVQVRRVAGATAARS